MIIPAEIPKADKQALLTRRHTARGQELAQKQLPVHVGIIEHLCAQIRHRPETRDDTFSGVGLRESGICPSGTIWTIFFCLIF